MSRDSDPIRRLPVQVRERIQDDACLWRNSAPDLRACPGLGEPLQEDTASHIFSSLQIGLFGFVAIGGALAAPWFGRMADRASPERAQMLTTALMLAGLAISVIWSHSTVAFTVAIFLIDVGVQGTQVNNLAQLYGLDETAHSRINAVFMTIFFVGGAIGTYCGVLAWSIGGRPLVSAQLLAWTSGALVIAVVNDHARTSPAGGRAQ